jgi:enoyl-CoA hydratase/carnithine racemase
MSSWQLDRCGCTARLTLSRPPVNALDQQALHELATALGEVAADRASRALVVTGGLHHIFCSGGDLKFWRRIRDGRQVSESGRSVFERLERLEIPTIAALNGSVIGDGLALALACDIRIACELTSFRLPEVAYGFIPGWLPIRSLTAIVGRAEATNMLLTGRAYDAARAMQVGLVHEVVPSKQLEEAAMAHARALAAASAPAVRAAKCALRGGDERECFRGVWGNQDWEEGIGALLGKRPAKFAGEGATE